MLVLLTLQHLRDFLLGLDPSSKLKYFNYFFLLCIFFLCIQLKLTPFCCTSQCRLTSYFVIRVILSEYCEEEAPNFYYVCETMKCLGTHISNVSPPAFSNRSKWLGTFAVLLTFGAYGAAKARLSPFPLN